MGCCECAGRHCRTPVIAILSVLQLGAAAAIVAIIFYHLTDYDLVSPKEVVEALPDGGPPVDTVVTNYQCALGTFSTGDDMCIYGYAVSGISMVVTLLLMISSCICCACWMYVDLWLELTLTILGTLWWAVAATLATIYAEDTNKTTDQTIQKWRRIVFGLAWVEVVLFAIMYFMAQGRWCYKVCGCCGGKEAARKRREEAQAKKDMEAAATAAAAAATAAPITSPAGGMKGDVEAGITTTASKSRGWFGK